MQATSLNYYVDVLWKRRLVVVVVLASCILGAFALTSLSYPLYEAKAQLFVGQRQLSIADVPRGQTLADLSEKLLRSYAAILRTHPIAKLAIDQADLPQTPRQLAGEIRADAIAETRIIEVKYRSSSPELAQRTANAVARAFVTEAQRLEQPPGTPQGEPAVRVSVIEPALRPSIPVEPQPIRNYGIAIVLGLGLGMGAALLLELLDTTVNSKDDVERTLLLPVLAAVPQIQTRREELYLEGDNRSPFAEAFRKLRTAIQLFPAESRHRTILVTSPQAQEGKSTTAINLAASYAYSGSPTVLVEADLRRPKMHDHFSGEELNGFTMALLGRISIDQAIVRTFIDHLWCIPAGSIPPNPVELIGSDQTKALLDELKYRFETIIIDAPPLLPVADATTIAPRVDGVLLVARRKVTRRDQLRESCELLQRVGGRVVGVVLNAILTDTSGSGYAYYESGRAKRGRFHLHGRR